MKPKTLKMLSTYEKKLSGGKLVLRKGTLQKLRNQELEDALLAGGYAEDVNSKKKKSAKPSEASSKKPAEAPAKASAAPKSNKDKE